MKLTYRTGSTDLTIPSDCDIYEWTGGEQNIKLPDNLSVGSLLFVCNTGIKTLTVNHPHLLGLPVMISSKKSASFIAIGGGNWIVASAT